MNKPFKPRISEQYSEQCSKELYTVQMSCDYSSMTEQFELSFSNRGGDESGYEQWKNSCKAKVVPRPGWEKQPELTFKNSGSERGYKKWTETVRSQRAALERHYGLVFNRPVKLRLNFLEAEVEGRIECRRAQGGVVSLRINNLNFFPEEVESVVALAA